MAVHTEGSYNTHCAGQASIRLSEKKAARDEHQNGKGKHYPVYICNYNLKETRSVYTKGSSFKGFMHHHCLAQTDH